VGHSPAIDRKGRTTLVEPVGPATPDRVTDSGSAVTSVGRLAESTSRLEKTSKTLPRGPKGPKWDGRGQAQRSRRRFRLTVAAGNRRWGAKP
jgi:hypothetical protein